MAFVLNPVQLVLLALLVLILILVLYMKKSLRYWDKRNMPSVEGSIPFGSLKNPIISQVSLGVQYKQLYEKLKEKGVRYGGIYSFLSPVFVPVDPEIIKLIVAKDFQYFHSRGFYSNERDQPISAHLFSHEGERWKNLRTKLTPTFTSGKMKYMFDMVLNCARQMEKEISKYAVNGEALDIKEFTSLYTTDVMGSCAFGIDCNSFKDPDAIIFKMLRRAMDGVNRLFKGAFLYSFPNLSRRLKMVPFPCDSVDYFTKFIADMVSYREKNNIRRADFLQILIDLKENQESNNDATKLTLDEIIAQCFVFFLAGFDTSSVTISFCLFEFAQQPHIQNKTRENIRTILEKYNGEITYDGLSEMKYLRQVVDETLRKYPVLPILHRRCNERYEIPGSNDTLEVGTQIIVPTMGIHYDPEHYPDPDKFDPDRFSEENKKKMNPYTYLPFGEGPRHCIGSRFGVMETMTGLVVLLKDFNFTLNAKTIVPMQFNDILLLQASTDILLDVKRI